MADAGVDIAALLRAVAAGPGGRATVNDVAASLVAGPAHSSPASCATRNAPAISARP
jgi:pyruvate/2-oxoglutarate dehydrogenase complex dihydrolipoamide acyltransferase (E2) component